jgi:hypothetical protein
MLTNIAALEDEYLTLSLLASRKDDDEEDEDVEDDEDLEDE